ncbi:MAG: branched-chain amino acid transport system substrate-binding protein [Desulfobacteraceae bacterium Eth-SRB1]|nr:MAG: branched-chain amino acid transport system substrate-binding protein [Desulfobacteraceae bacterium Eth-SRB1]
MKKFIRMIVCLVVLFSVFNTISAKANSKDQKLVGVILPFSSAFVNIANEQKNAIELAVKEFDDIKVIYEDSKSDEAGAIEAFNKFTNMENSPFAIISCASWVATALHPLSAKENIFHIVIGSAIIERTQPKHTVRFTLDANQEEKQLANYLIKFNRIAIYNMDNGYGNNWKKTIEQNLSDKIVKAIAYNPQNKDFKDDLAEIKKANPDVLVLLSAGNAAIIAKQARELGITAKFVGTRPIERSELLQEAQYTDGLVYTYPSYDRYHPMIAKYTKEYGNPPTVFAVEAYDSMKSLLTAAKEGNHSTEALFDWYAGRTYIGALGEVHFDENGDANYPYMYKEISDGKFKTANFQYSLLLENARQEINKIFQHIDQDVKKTSEKLSVYGLTGKEVNKALQNLFERNEYVYDCTTIDAKGIIKNVYPKKYEKIIGADISKQPQIARLHKTNEPVVSEAIDTVEGFLGFDLEHPIFDENGEFIGSLSVLTEPNFFDRIISQKVANFPVEMWIMQKDGTVIYDVNEEEIGQNLFTDEIYAPYKSLIKLAIEMSITPHGSGGYSFLDKKLDKTVEKKIIWTTIAMHGTEVRLALAHVKDDF